MHNLGTNYKIPLYIDGFRLTLIVVLFSVLGCLKSYAQTCPPNIDFEQGNFDGWTCYTGGTAAIGNDNVITLTSSGGPQFDRHTMYSGNSGGVDFYGGFPVNCPNGSGHSIKLGNDRGGTEAEGVSYEFTIPSNQNYYSLIYHYAVVFQSPNHRDIEQPRMEIEITNVTDNAVISCASFTFIAMGTSLPGFMVSDQGDSTTVLYKGWSAVSVDLSGNAGKTIRMFFKTADCTFRRHFGYAYIDVNSECNGKFVGSTFCPDDTLVNIVAPYGYQGYTWFDSSLRKVLGNTQVLTLSPPPSSGTTLAVKLDPFNGYGCPNTLYTELRDSLTVVAYAGSDIISCNMNPVQIGTNSRPGLIYKWLPVTNLSNPDISNPLAAPDITTKYIVTTSNSGGGCRSTDSVIVRASVIDSSLQVIGKPTYCIDNEDSAVLKVKPGNNIQWYKNDIPISGATQVSYRATTNGIYYAFLQNATGCSMATRKQPIVIDKAKPAMKYAVIYAIVDLPLTLQARQIGDQVLWRPPTSLNEPTSFTPTFRGATEKLYTIDITTSTGCLTVDTQLVKIISKVEIYVPTAFTPNSDGKNDYLRFIPKGLKKVEIFRIFNRWGQLLFETKTELPGWDGTFKGIPLDTQTVVWYLKGEGIDGVNYNMKGTSLLLR